MARLRAGTRLAVLSFFFASGATGLVLEVVWTRILGVVFGNTVYAASTVLAAYMLGLALGSAVLGRIADRVARPLLLYGCLEIGVGVCAASFPLLAALSSEFYGWFYRAADPGFSAITAVRFVCSLALLLPPTFLMGGTLPVLGRFLEAHRRERGKEVGYLYGANTCGAVAGCFLAGFVLIEALGVRGSLAAAAATAGSIGILAVALGRHALADAAAAPTGKRPRAARRGEEAPAPLDPATFRLILVGVAAAGFCSLAYEVIWTRVLLFVLTTTVYAFATRLASVLAGLGLGSFAAARFIVPRLRRPVLAFGAIELLVGLAALCSVPMLANLEAIDARIAVWLAGRGAGSPVLLRFLDAAFVLFIPAFLMGAAFPVATTACLGGQAPIGWRVGQVYAANTFGCVAGACAAGFLLLPALGAHRSLLALVACNLAVGLVVVSHARARSAAARLALGAPVAGLVAAAFAVTPSDVFHRTINTYHNPAKIAFLEEHPTGTVTVHDLPNGERLIAVDGVNVAGRDFMLRSTQKLQGYIPLCLHPDPRRVVQIGFGSGETARVGLEFGVPEYTVVEICPAVFHAGSYFESINKGSYRDPRIRRIIMDGKNFALLSGETFDIVMNDSVYPGSSGSSALYTADHFRNCRERLADGGLFSCWVPLDLTPEQLRMILKSFHTVFPNMSLWIASNCVNKHSLFLGSLEPLRIDAARLGAVLGRPAIAADLAEIEINDIYDFLDCHVMDATAIQKLVEGDSINTDDRPLLEFWCARQPASDPRLAEILHMVADNHAPVAPCVINLADAAELDRRFAATNHIFRGQWAQLCGMRGMRRLEFGEALKASPGEAHVRSCDEELAREIRDLRSSLGAGLEPRPIALRLADKLFIAFQDEEAAALGERLIAMGPPPPESVFIQLAEIRFGQGRLADAKGILERCLGIRPDSAEAHDRLAKICLTLGQRAAALDHIGRAVSLDPENKTYQRHLEQIRAAR